MTMLTAYLEFLPLEGQDIIAQLRQDAQEPLSIIAGIHWVIHNPDVASNLTCLIAQELNKIITKLNASNYSTMQIKSVAALTLTPDKCYEECFGEWEDYASIQSLIPSKASKYSLAVFFISMLTLYVFLLFFEKSKPGGL